MSSRQTGTGRFSALAALTAVAALTMTSCGGGGGGSTTPNASSASSPASASHTVVGTGKLTLSLPKVVTAKRDGKTVAVRAIPHGTQRALPKGKTRSPLFVDPSPNPGNGPCTGLAAGDNYIDLYDNGTLLTNLDGYAGASDSLCVQQTADSTQTVSVPLYSGSSNEIVAVEWDATGTYVLALGESDNGSISAGSTNTLNTLTMLMNASYIGITDLAFSEPVLAFDDPSYGSGLFYCSGTGSTAQFGLYETDALGNFIPVAGSGGTSTPTASGTADAGNTVMAQTTIPGVYNVAWDAGCDSISMNASGPNPAYTIYNDVANYANQNAYPGISYLYDNDINYIENWLNDQLNYQTVSGSADITNSPS